MKEEDKLLAEMCRYAEAAKTGGFDGFEHPENEKVVSGVLSALYPLTLDHIIDIKAGRIILRRAE